MFPTAHVLIVDDEAVIRASLHEMLIRDGYHVTTAESGEVALELIENQTFDLALIDLKMKGIGGIEVLKALRQQAPDTVAIVLTAHASLETAVEALRLGAHDYLFKPCKPAELRQSIRQGLLSRSENRQADLLRQLEQVADSLEDIRSSILEQPRPPSIPIPQPSPEQGRFLQWERLIIDFLRHVVTLDGELLDLTPTEFDILACLVKEAPRVVPPQELLYQARGYESEPWEASEIVRQHIYRIRQKIKDATGRKYVIRTVRGVGYKIDK